MTSYRPRFVWDPDDTVIANSEQQSGKYHRPLTAAERRVDFDAVGAQIDDLQAKHLRVIRDALRDVEARLLDHVRRRFSGRAAEVQALKRLRGMDRVQAALQAWLITCFKTGRVTMRAELPGETKHADEPNFIPRAALEYLRTKAIQTALSTEGKLLDQIRSALMRSIETGRSTRDTVEELDKVFDEWTGETVGDVTPWRLETIVRTETTDAYNRGRLVEGRANPLVEAWQYSAVMDDRTTEVCRHLDGKVFKSNDPALDKLKPPRHFNCRSILVPIVIGDEYNPEDVIDARGKRKAVELSGAGFKPK